VRFAERLPVELERRVAADDEFAEGIRVIQNSLSLGLCENVHHVCGVVDETHGFGASCNSVFVDARCDCDRLNASVAQQSQPRG
jgi:hypothetical protein